jgi:hypothetical protein
VQRTVRLWLQLVATLYFIGSCDFVEEVFLAPANLGQPT